MTIESELKRWLAHNLSEKVSGIRVDSIERDRNIILEYYGFGSAACPTYEQIGERFDAGTRQNVENLISRRFKTLARIERFQGLVKLSSFVMRHPFLPVKELADWMVDQGLGAPSVSVRGVLRLATELGGVSDREFYDCRLERAGGRDGLDRDGGFTLASSKEHKRLLGYLRRARKAPGFDGLCRINWIRETVDNGKDAETIIGLIRSDSEVVVVEEGADEWYLIETRQNKLINECDKVFGLVTSCKLEELTQNLQRSLKGRTAKVEYPSEQVIRSWVRVSNLFRVESETVSYTGDVAELTPAELRAVEFLRENGSSTWEQMRAFLMENEVSDASAKKIIGSSSFIKVDKSGGKKSYTYSLIGDVRAMDGRTESEAERYDRFRQRLSPYLEKGTDNEVETIARNEQGILQEWLFEGRSVCHCAICGDLFSVDALHAAHKKKRSECSPEERVDPYIVFPVCVFGCDYLYEARLIRISGGRIMGSGEAPLGTYEAKRIAELEGREVSQTWLKGKDTYFH